MLRVSTVAITFEPFGTVIGAEVRGLSLAEVPAGAALDALEAGLERHGVLVFPDQDITPDQQVAFSRPLGPLERTQLVEARLPEREEIFVVGNTGETPVTFSPAAPEGALEWHSDHIHWKTPARASLLYARAVPRRGGDTLFACMYSAYDDLAPERRAECERLRVINSVSGLRAYLAGEGHAGATKERLENPQEQGIHPLVRAHPLTGRKALYFGSQVSIGIVGWHVIEARGFIADLTERACRPAFRYRHRWRVGDAVLWDNRRVLHAGTHYDLEAETRLMHRTTIRETVPIEMV